jgi:hypothetical protein
MANKRLVGIVASAPNPQPRRSMIEIMKTIPKILLHWSRGLRAAFFICIAMSFAFLPAGICNTLHQRTNANAPLAILTVAMVLVVAPCLLYALLRNFNIGFLDWFIADGKAKTTESKDG